MYLSIPDWIPSVTSASTLNSQDDLPRIQTNTVAWGTPIPVHYGPYQMGGRIYAFDHDLATGTFTVGYLVGVGELGSMSVLINGEAPVAGVSVNTYLGTTGQGVDPLLVTAIPGYADTLVHTSELGSIGIAHVVIQYNQSHYQSRPSVLASGDGRKVWNGTSTVYSDNPTYCLADLIRDPFVGLGDTTDDTSMIAAAATNDETVTTEARRKLGISLLSPQETTQWIDILRAYACVWPVKRGDVWHFIPDRPAAVDATLTAADYLRDSFMTGESEPVQTPTVVRIIYANTSNPVWVEEEVCYPSSLGVGVPRRESLVRMPGVHRRSQAMREAVERYNKLQHSDTYTFIGYDTQLRREVGDILDVSHPMGVTNSLMRLTAPPKVLRPGRIQLTGVEYSASDYDDSEVAETGNTTSKYVGSAPLTGYNIGLPDGNAIEFGAGTLTVQARFAQQLLTSGTIQLYVGTTLVTAANGFGAGSDGFTGIFDASHINGNVVVALKNGPAGAVIASQTLFDIADRSDLVPDPNFLITNQVGFGPYWDNVGNPDVVINPTAAENGGPALEFVADPGITAGAAVAGGYTPAIQGDQFFCRVRVYFSADYNGTGWRAEIDERDEDGIQLSSFPDMVNDDDIVLGAWQTLEGFVTVVHADTRFVELQTATSAAFTVGNIYISHITIEKTQSVRLGTNIFGEDGSTILADIDLRNDAVVVAGLGGINENPSMRIPRRNDDGDLAPASWFTGNETTRLVYYNDNLTRDVMVIERSRTAVNAPIPINPDSEYELRALVRTSAGTKTARLRAEYITGDLPSGGKFIGGNSTPNGEAGQVDRDGSDSSVASDLALSTTWTELRGVWTPPASATWFSPSFFDDATLNDTWMEWFVVLERPRAQAGVNLLDEAGVVVDDVDILNSEGIVWDLPGSNVGWGSYGTVIGSYTPTSGTQNFTVRVRDGSGAVTNSRTVSATVTATTGNVNVTSTGTVDGISISVSGNNSNSVTVTLTHVASGETAVMLFITAQVSTGGVGK